MRDMGWFEDFVGPGITKKDLVEFLNKAGSNCLGDDDMDKKCSIVETNFQGGYGHSVMTITINVYNSHAKPTDK